MTSSKPSDDASLSSIGRRRDHARRDPSAGYVERRDRLLAAAAEVFAEKGLDASSINDIASRLGSDRASVYYYYRSKQEIFLALVSKEVGEIVQVAEEIAQSPVSARNRMQQLVEDLMQSYERYYPILFINLQTNFAATITADGVSDPSNLIDLMQRYESAVNQIVTDGVANGEFRKDLDTRLATLAVLGAMNWSHRWFVPGGRLSGSEIGRTFADLFVNGIREPRRRK